MLFKLLLPALRNDRQRLNWVQLQGHSSLVSIFVSPFVGRDMNVLSIIPQTAVSAALHPNTVGDVQSKLKVQAHFINY